MRKQTLCLHKTGFFYWYTTHSFQPESPGFYRLIFEISRFEVSRGWKICIRIVWEGCGGTISELYSYLVSFGRSIVNSYLKYGNNE